MCLLRPVRETLSLSGKRQGFCAQFCSVLFCSADIYPARSSEPGSCQELQIKKKVIQVRCLPAGSSQCHRRESLRMQGGDGVTQGDIESEGRSGVADKKGSRSRRPGRIGVGRERKRKSNSGRDRNLEMGMVVLGVAGLEVKQRLGSSHPLCWEAEGGSSVLICARCPHLQVLCGPPPFPSSHGLGSFPFEAPFLVHLPPSEWGLEEKREAGRNGPGAYEVEKEAKLRLECTEHSPFGTPDSTNYLR